MGRAPSSRTQNQGATNRALYECDVNLYGRTLEDVQRFLARSTSTEGGDGWGSKIKERLSKGFRNVELLVVKRSAQLDKEIAQAKIVLLWKVS